MADTPRGMRSWTARSIAVHKGRSGARALVLNPPAAMTNLDLAPDLVGERLRRDGRDQPALEPRSA